MIIVKLTALLTLIVVFMIVAFKAWCESHPVKAIAEDYPWWAYVMAILVMINVIGIFASAIWFLFFYL